MFAWSSSGSARRLLMRDSEYSNIFELNFRFSKTVWPSSLRRWLKAPFRKGVGSNPTAVIHGFMALAPWMWSSHHGGTTPTALHTTVCFHTCKLCSQSNVYTYEEKGVNTPTPFSGQALIKTVWPSGLRRWLKAPFRKGVASNPAAVTSPGSSLLLRPGNAR